MNQYAIRMNTGDQIGGGGINYYYDNNVVFNTTKHIGEDGIHLIVIRPITKNQEIFIDYGDEYQLEKSIR